MTLSIAVRGVAFAPPAVVLVLFSQVSPLAPAVLDFLTGLPHAVGYLACAMTACAALWLWHRGYGSRPDAWLLITLLAGGSAVFCFPAFPCVVPAVLTLQSAALLYIAMCWLPEEKPQDWLELVRNALLSASLWCFVIWCIWILYRLPVLSKWTDWDPEFHWRVRDNRVSWKIAEVMWMVPLGISSELLVMALLCWFQKNQISMERVTPGDDQVLSSDQVYLISQVKLLGLLVCIATMVLWLGAALSATGGRDVGHRREDMRDEVMGLTFWLFAGISAWLLYNLGPEKVKQAAMKSKVALRVLEMAQGEWAKAGYLFCFAPFLLVYTVYKRFVIKDEAVVQEGQSQRQAVRGQRGALQASLLRAAELFGSHFMQQLWTTSVILKAQLLGLGYVSFEVGMKATLVCLAYTNDLLANLNVFLVSIAIFVVGTFLFLLPPTPGPPVYALIGIVVVASAQNSGGSSTFGVFLAILVAFAIKMAFAAIAQKYIGEPMAKSVKIRSLVQVHTTEIRAIEMVLKEPGISPAKVAILIGGPDWPVAVLCGILRLPLVEVLLALSPVLLQSIVPCVLSGALLVIFGDDEHKKALGESAVAVAGGLQIAALIVAGYYIQEAIEVHYDELQRERPEDKDVIELEKESNKQDEEFKEKTAWERMPRMVRCVLVGGLVAVYASCLLLAGPWKMFLGTACFKKFELTSTVSEALGGNPFAVVEPLGWLAIFFSLLSTALLVLFHYYYYREAQQARPSAAAPDSSPRQGECAPLTQP